MVAPPLNRNRTAHLSVVEPDGRDASEGMQTICRTGGQHFD
jgi:hypothetical protein